MKKLKNLFKLSHKVSIYCPTQDKTGKPCTDYTNTTATMLSQRFGGATSTPCRGYWEHESGVLQAETVSVVYAYAEKLTDSDIDAIVRHAEDIKTETAQDAVAVEIDGELYFV